MEITREIIDKVPHIITDYMYQNDNVGINLTLLNTMKTTKKLEVAGIPIDYAPVSLNKINNVITITSTMNYDSIDGELTVLADVKYPNNTVIHHRKLEDKDFAEDIINTCIVDKKDIKNMKCYKEAFNSIVDAVKESSLEENMLIKTPELNYKCYVYDNNMDLLGIANRLLQCDDGYILGEYVGKKLSEHIGRSIFVDMCINEDITLQLANVNVCNCIDSSLSYAKIDTSLGMVKRLTENYTSIKMWVPESFVFPVFNKFKNINNYFEDVLVLNSPKGIEDFFKNNKPKTNTMIDLNKYLIW